MKNIFNFIKKHSKISLAVTITGLLSFSIIKNFNLFNINGVINVIFGKATIITNAPVLDTSETKLISEDKIKNENKSEAKNLPAIELKKENKDNSSLHDAISIENNQTYFIKFTRKGIEKFYKFTLDYKSIVNFSFGFSGDTSYKFIVQNSDSNIKIVDTELFSKNINQNGNNLYLRAGNYFVKITAGNLWKNKTGGNDFNFKVKISSDDTGLIEAENNNEKNTANIIPLNKTIKASSAKSDIDYFTFTLDKRSLIFLEISFIPLENYTMKLYELNIKNALGGDIETFNFRGDSKISGKAKNLELGAGTYLICISRVEDTSKLELGLHEYNLCISAKEII